MKKAYKILLVILFFGIMFLFVQKTLALDLGGDIAGKTAIKASYEDVNDPGALSKRIGKIISVALSMLGVVFLLLTFYAGYLWLLARGEEEDIKKAQKILSTAVIGILIVVGAYGTTNLVVSGLVGRTISTKKPNDEIPNLICCLRNYNEGANTFWGGVIVKQVDDCIKSGDQGWGAWGDEAVNEGECRGDTNVLNLCETKEVKSPEECQAIAEDYDVNR
ncbi:MAG TPA: hypothetical protein DEB09_04545 [Candidatus Magasanikbacteria bacterium]|nr:hypothetical protein [Candidatus Magasanikbacteria bacterium]